MSQFRNLLRKPAMKAFLGLTLGAAASYSLLAYKNPSPPSIDINEPQQASQKLKIKEPVVVVEQKKEEPLPAADPEPQAQQKSEQVSDIQKKSQQAKPSKTERRLFKHLREIEELRFEDIVDQQQRIMIVADLPYNEQFEAKIISQVNKIRQKYGDIKIYRKDLSKKETQNILHDQHKARVKEQTIFLVKNPYEKGMTNIDFDIFMQYPALTEAYLKDVALYDDTNIGEVTARLQNLSPYESVLLYVYDKNEPEEKIKQRMLAAKYIEMQMIINNLHGVRLQVVDKNASVSQQLITPDTARTNSVHLFRKHNIYTPFQPNFYLPREGNTSVPFHRMADIALFAKGSQNIIINHYLAGLQTFDAIANPAPFMCTLRIDRNKVSEQEYNRIIRVFGQLKRKNLFPGVSFALKLKKVPYSGKEVPTNKQWQITLGNVDKMDKQAMMHEIKTHQQLKTLGFDQISFLKTSNEYLYEHTELNEQLLSEFIQKGLKDQLSRYYKSEPEHPLAAIRGLSGREFDQTIMNNNKDHLVYQYSEFCPTCKKISPIIGAFARVIQEKGMGLQTLMFHKFNANKNRARGQLSSPYIPNIFFYKNQWKKAGPVRFPIQMFGTQGLISLYAFCSITSELKTIDWAVIDKAIKSHQSIRDASLLI